jgi:hypothetical protein
MNNYTNNQELNREILIWINERILSLLEMYMDLGNDTEWDFEYLYICFPRNFIEDNGTKECLRVLNDISDILKSSYIQKNMKLLYKYVLIKLIEYYQVLYEGAKMCKEQDLCDIYFSPVEEVLAKKIYKEFGYEFDNVIADDVVEEDENHPQIFIEMSLEDIDGLFWDDVFDDTEVDIDSIDQFVDECTDKIKQGQFVQWDLDDYLDLMSRGVKERYQKVNPLLIKIQEKMTETMAENVVSDYIKTNMKKSLSKDTLLEDICTACMLLQGSEKNILKDENARNTYIRDILRSKGYVVADQTLRGESASRKRLGELDFEIMKTAEMPFAIYEALNLKNLSNSEQEYLDSHLNKLLDNYNPMGITIAFLVSYAKCTKANFDNYCSEYFKYIKYNSYKYHSTHSECEHKQFGNYLRCVECNYECGGTFTTVYHIVVRMNE